MARRHESLIPLAKDHYEGLLLEEQIRKEDRVLFPLLENEATPEVLEAMRQKLAPYYPE